MINLRVAVSAAVLCVFSGMAMANPATWKARGWSKTDFSKSSVPFDEILSGGPPKDGIPSIDNPVFTTASKVTDLGQFEPVIQVEINGDARAYPLRILTWHEIVNDVVGGMPVAVTYCPLCNSSIVFHRVMDGKVLDFGTTGKLRNSDLVMYDRQTESWWQQFIGKGLIGTYTDRKLKMIPSQVIAFNQFRDRYPEGKVLIPNSPGNRGYGRNPYVNYDSRRAPYGLYRGTLPKDINPMARVIVVKGGDSPSAATLQSVRDQGSLTLGEVTLTWTKGQNSALDTSRISEGRDVGNVSAYRMSAGKKEPVVHDITFAFVVHAFYPDLKIVK